MNTLPKFEAIAGDTVMLREGSSHRWVRITHTLPACEDGTQSIVVEDQDQFGRGKGRTVKLNRFNSIEWRS